MRSLLVEKPGDVVIIVVAVGIPESVKFALELYKQIKLKHSKTLVSIVCNKVDLWLSPSKDQLEEIEEFKRQNPFISKNMSVERIQFYQSLYENTDENTVTLECSALTGEGIDCVFSHAISEIIVRRQKIGAVMATSAKNTQKKEKNCSLI